MKKVCVYPGSFDPITRGHLDIVERASAIFDEVIVAILHNPAKKGRITIEQRLAWIEKACAHLPNVRTDHFGGLLADYMRQSGARVIVRGLRGVSDFESEFQMAQLNRMLNPNAETLFLATSPEYASLSSSAVREIGMFGGDITPFVPSCIAQEVSRMIIPNHDR